MNFTFVRASVVCVCMHVCGGGEGQEVGLGKLQHFIHGIYSQ